MIALKPRTTYRTAGGNLVRIAGLTRYAVQGFPGGVMWSIGGDWYCALTGKFLCLDKSGGQYYTLSATFCDNLVAVEDTAEARNWWVGVNTERRTR